MFIRTSEEDDKRDVDAWYHVSDANVKACGIRDVLKSEAYMLFYERLEL